MTTLSSIAMHTVKLQPQLTRLGVQFVERNGMTVFPVTNMQTGMIENHAISFLQRIGDDDERNFVEFEWPI